MRLRHSKDEYISNRKYDHALVCKLAEDGKTVEQITRELSIKSCSRVIEILQKNNSPIVHEQLDIGKIKALRKARWTIEKIADEMNLDEETIAKVLEG